MDSKQDTFKETHTETSYTQTVERQKQREYLESKREVIHHTHPAPPTKLA